MLPKQINYPEFVPDQLLTSDHLNQLFRYLEEQGRLTRTNLIGIGIVCGLEVKTDAAGTSITITKGTGVTSEGYLVTVPEITYTAYKKFDAVQDLIYDRFVDSSRAQRFNIDELKQAAVEEGTTVLSNTYLKDKVVLLYVELLEVGAKNCDAESCDDKGVNVTVTFRPLLVDKANAESLLAGSGNSVNSYQDLGKLKMRRFDVKATPLVDTAAIFEAYQKVLNLEFLEKTETLLSQAYTTFSPLVIDLYPSDPFNGLAENFKFLTNDPTVDQLVNIQYFYDLFSDLLLAYDELRKAGTYALSICCPDGNLFPRHLLLDLAVPDPSKTTSNYRHYFIPSPILAAKSVLTGELRFLFQRLVLLLEKFQIPNAEAASSYSKKKKADANIRITPSKFGDIPLSEKSIPFYYKPASGPLQLYKNWNHEKARLNEGDQILSYHAKDYNSEDDEVINPLLYDLEPTNFLRIEGHIGKPYQDVMRNIIALKSEYRLPFEVIALSGDVSSLKNQMTELKNFITTGDLKTLDDKGDYKVKFQDLESLYDTMAAELTSMLCMEMKYFYGMPGDSKTLPDATDLVPKVLLLKKADPNFRFASKTLGHEFEIYWATIQNAPYITPEAFLAGLSSGATSGSKNILGLALLYYIEKLSESVSTNLSNFDYQDFSVRYQDLIRVALFTKAIVAGGNSDSSFAEEDIIDHLDSIIYLASRQPAFVALYTDYISRWMYILMLQKFGYFIRLHPGIQHKAGVTIGGTFIIVYHEETKVVEQETPNIRGNATTPAADTTLSTNGNNAVKAANLTAEEAAKKRNDEVRAQLAGQTLSLSSDAKSTATAAAASTSSQESLPINQASQKPTGETKLTPIMRVEELDVNESRTLSTTQKQIVAQLLETKEGNQTLDDLVADIIDGTVIADFYLPYLCYSDAPPINFILQDSKPTDDPEKLTINIEPKEFCIIDKTAYPVEVSPEGGTVTGEGIKLSNGKTTFNPSEINLAASGNKKSVKLTYKKDSESVTIDITVFQKPVAAFEAQIVGREINKFDFTNQSQFGQTYEWDFDDGATSTEENPQHEYEQEGAYKVRLKVINGVCSTTATKTLTIKKPAQDKLSINIEPKEFCAVDKSIYSIEISPEDGTVTGEGTSLQDGKAFFDPTKVAMQTVGNQKKVTLTYSKDEQSSVVEVTVFQKPIAAFDAQTIGKAINKYSFTNQSQFGQTYEWDFGDGATSDEQSPNHEYEKEGSYKVGLRVVNGSCSTSTSKTIVIKKPVKAKTCAPVNEIIDRFHSLESLSPNLFPGFQKYFDSYKEVEEFFISFKEVSRETVDKQIDFLANFDIVKQMSAWLEKLQNVIFQTDFRELGLALYYVLVKLAMYIACIQIDDIDKATNPLNGLFQVIYKHLSAILGLLPNLSDSEKEQILKFYTDIKAERLRVKNNSEETNKPKYLTALEALLDLFLKNGI